MKIALFSDIHGNSFALDAVLTALAQEPIDQFVCLGDVALDGVDPKGTLARLRSLNCQFVMGNTDAFALEPVAIKEGESPIFHAIDLWSANLLDSEDRAFIHTFEPALTLELGNGKSLRCYHGSPTSYHEIVLPTMHEEELEQKLGKPDRLLFAGGHVHQQYMRRWRQSIVINPGSVGLPYEILPSGEAMNPWWAEYALLTVEGDTLQIDLRRQPYDAQPMIDGILKSDMPYKEQWIEGWLTAIR